MSIALPLLSSLPPSPTSFLSYHAILSKQIRKLRKVLSLSSADSYSSVIEKLSHPDTLSQSELFNHIWIIILNAERAWAYGMRLKTDYQTGSGNSVRQHSIKRFAKAAKWADIVKESPAAAHLDERGKIELEAYTNWLQGTVSLEKELYAQAAKNFSESNAVYQQLAKVGNVEQRSIYAKRASEIESLVKFCQYEFTRKSGNPGEIQMIETLLSEDRSSILSDKLEAVLEEERKKQASSVQTVNFLNKDIIVQNERVRMSILKAQSIEKDLKRKNIESRLRLYERLLLAYGEGVNVLQEDVRRNASNTEYVEQSRLLNTFLSYNYLMTIVSRNEILIQNLTKSDEADRTLRTNQEITHLYDIILQNMDEALDLPEIDSNTELVQCLEARKSFYRGYKLFYLARSFKLAGKVKEVYALFKSALSVISGSKANVTKHEDIQTQQQSLENDVKAELLTVHAQLYLNEVRPQSGPTTVFSNLNSYPTQEIPELIAFPPAFEKIPCKPMFFDIAGNYVKLPDFKTQKKGWLGFW